MNREIARGIYLVELPMPATAMGGINCYLAPRPGRGLVVDSGLANQTCRDILLVEMRALGMDPGRCDFLITHHHADHLGLAARLAGAESRIFIGEREKRLLDRGEFWRPALARGAEQGFTDRELREVDERYRQGYPVGLLEGLAVVTIAPGDKLELAGLSLDCLAAPGHSQGELSFACREMGITFSGDHVLAELTPSVHTLVNGPDPLRQYLASLRDLANAPPLFWPGHGPAMPDGPARTVQLAARHQERLAEVRQHLAVCPLNAAELARRITWRNPPGAGEQPLWMRWIAFGEADAYLVHLAGKGEAAPEGIGRYRLL